MWRRNIALQPGNRLSSANSEYVTWRTDLPSAEWDAYLASMYGHPLQSSFWGDARKAVDGIENHRWAAFLDGSPVLLARVEVRRIPLLGKVAWLPRGPAVRRGKTATSIAYRELLAALRREGFLLCIDDPYRAFCDAPVAQIPLLPKARTVLIDLTHGRDRLWSALNPQWRSRVRKAQKAGLVVEQTRKNEDIAAFFKLCKEISKEKKFDLPGSENLLRNLCHGSLSADVQARLFVARDDGELAAGVVALRCGRSLHFFWGASDRRFTKQRPSEAVQWGVIEWGLQNGVEIYDLEGIDPEKNAGTYQFKMKLRGSYDAARQTCICVEP